MTTVPPHAQNDKPRKRLAFYDGSRSSRVNSRINRTGNVGAHHQDGATVIYGLVDPRDREVFYIGLTDNLYLRFKQHVLMSGDNERKQSRIQAILDAYMLPWMLTLEVVDDNANPGEREIAWIQAYRESGVHLLNDEVYGEPDTTPEEA